MARSQDYVVRRVMHGGLVLLGEKKAASAAEYRYCCSTTTTTTTDFLSGLALEKRKINFSFLLIDDGIASC